jgi:deoxyxylulose-5-phosphate synthase
MTKNPLTVRFPNGQTMESTHTAFFDILELSKSAAAAHIFSAMENNSLLSVGQLCDEGYSLLFSISEVTIQD